MIVNAPRTDLTGGGTARGRGFKPATMFADLDFAFGPSRIDTIAVDSIAVKAQLADGLANVARAEVRGAGALVDLNGQFGLDASHTRHAALQRGDRLARDASRGTSRRASQPDTGVVKPRPRIAAEAVRRARAEVGAPRQADRGGARHERRADAAGSRWTRRRAIPRSLIAGSLRASGTIAGSIERFNLQGAANATGLVVRGNCGTTSRRRPTAGRTR